MKTAFRGVFAVAALAIIAGIETRASSGAGSGGPTTECSVAAIQAKAPQGTTITAAALVPAAAKVPAYCRVDGHVAVPGNAVNFRLGLPAEWNGKYYFSGVGGLGGSIGSLDAGLTRGYASASTDTGHTSDDVSWESNAAKKLDYGHRGTHVTAVAAKALTASYFDRRPEHAYFNGCSNGGRQAMMEVQRYPEDFDGIIAGDPATGTPMQVGRAMVFQKMLLHPDHYLPAEKVDLLARATLAACDETDGLKDGLISDPSRCTFQPEALKCSGADAPACLTAAQIETVHQIQHPLKTADGRVYTSGFPKGHEDGASGWRAWTVGRVPPAKQADGTLAFAAPGPSGYSLSESNFRFLALDREDPSYTWKTVKFPQDLPQLKAMTDVLSPLDPDLRPFKSRGGKILIYHGWADPAISANGTVDYYERMTQAVGGAAAAQSFSRLYLVPGMHHCGGGPGPNTFDMLPQLEAWVEKGIAPTRVIATHATDAVVDRSRPLCPHPQVARYTGSGSIDDAANFQCVAR